METQVLKVVGQIAGLAGISLGILYLLFREVIRKEFFPRMTKTQGFRTTVLFLTLVWSIALVGIVAWVWVETHDARIASDESTDSGIELQTGNLRESKNPAQQAHADADRNEEPKDANPDNNLEEIREKNEPFAHVVDFASASFLYERTKQGNVAVFEPKFDPGGFFRPDPKTGPTSPFELDIKLVNRARELAFLKEIQFRVERAILDPSFAMSYHPWVSPQRDLVLVFRNYGWTDVTINKCLPLADTLAVLLGLSEDAMNWSGRLHENLVFIVPALLTSSAINGVLAEEELNEIAGILSPTNFRMRPSKISQGRGVDLDEKDEQARNVYLDSGRGVSYERFSGKLSIENPDSSMVTHELAWGKSDSYCDLVFAEKGFHTQHLRMSPEAYVGPSQKYDLTLSLEDEANVRSLNVSHALSPSSADRLVVRMTSEKSAVYDFYVDLIFDTGRISSDRIRVSLFTLKENDPEKIDFFSFDPKSSSWVAKHDKTYSDAIDRGAAAWRKEISEIKWHSATPARDSQSKDP